ncbi:MAG: hypothetical protein RBS99_00230 [Rhodospirillales bacterium]|jgi:hypothetical protein|nr:hypothetical protein [Rhodospirillales bacterium]
MTGIRHRWVAGTLAVLLALATAADAADNAFFSGIDDLPLMAGLVERAGGAMVFDSPAGRVVEAEASGTISRAEVLAFYTATLPELGWRRQGETTFVRQRESLTLEIDEGPDHVVVRFVVSPAGP